MTRHRLTTTARAPLARCLALGLALSLGACEDVNTDPDPVGGSDPSGVIEGTVLYVGQHPECDYEDGAPARVRGRVVLLMFLSDNPPPPSGSAASAENLLVIPAGEMFDLADCLPESPSPPELTSVLTRSVSFTWPDVALAGAGLPDPSTGPDFVDYQIRGFFDRDEDFNPFFSVRRLATKGDVAGGAFVSTAEDPPQFARIRFENRADLPNGQVVSGVAVTLGAIVNTELPAFAVEAGTHGLSSEATIPPVPDAVQRERLLFELTDMRISLIDPREESWAFTLRAAGVSIDPHPSGYGFFTLPVDANRDGVQDPHPILGSAGILWEHPIVILRRARNPFELRAGIPDAVIVGTVRPSQTLAKQTFSPGIDIAVPPIAAVNLDPTNPACTVPYIAPGNVAETYERIPTDCQEVPTGNYDVNVLSGIAGGRAQNYRALIDSDMPGLPEQVLTTIVRIRTDNDWIIEGGSFSSQAWSVPNELGCPDPYRPNALDEDGDPITVSQLDPDPLASCGDPTMGCDATGTLMQCSQGPLGRMSVVDPDGSNAPVTPDHSPGHGIPSCQTTIRASTLMADTVNYMDVPAACCGGIQHLCGLPLCPLRDGAVRPGDGDVRAIRELRVPGEDFTVDEMGRVIPSCVPFLMPASCCE